MASKRILYRPEGGSECLSSNQAIPNIRVPYRLGEWEGLREG